MTMSKQHSSSKNYNNTTYNEPMMIHHHSFHSKPKYFFHDDMTPKQQQQLGTYHRSKIHLEEHGIDEKRNKDIKTEPEKSSPTKIMDPLLAYSSFTSPIRYAFSNNNKNNKNIHRSRLSSIMDLEISYNKDATTVSSEISLQGDDGELEEDIWDLHNDHQRLCPVDHSPKDSWTIHIYDRNHRAGDTVWFRVSYNSGTGFREYEDHEILEFIAIAIQVNPTFSFFVKTKSTKKGLESFAFYPANIILHVLTVVLQHAQQHHGIKIPTKAILYPTQIPNRGGSRRHRRTTSPPQKVKRNFLTWLFRVQFGDLDDQSELGEPYDDYNSHDEKTKTKTK